MAKINKYYFNVFNSYETYLMSIFVAAVVVNLTRLNKDIKMQFVNFSLLKFSCCCCFFIPSSFLKIKRDFLRDHVFIYRFLFVYS